MADTRGSWLDMNRVSLRRIARWPLSLGAALLVAVGGCRSEPVDTQALFTAYGLGLNDLQLGRLPEAEAQFKKVIALAPNDPLGHANLGLTYLRGGRYEEAEAQLRRARRMDPNNPEIGLMTAKLFSLTERANEAKDILENLRPDAKVLYALAELEHASTDAGATRRYQDRLRQVLTLSPGNLAVRLKLADAFLRSGAADSARRLLVEVRRLRPEPPALASAALDTTLGLLHADNGARAQDSFERFMDLMELTVPYQSSLETVRWLDGPLVGTPVLAFHPQTLIATRGVIPVDRSTDVRFTDATQESGLPAGGGSFPTALAMGDYDGDGSDNLFAWIATSVRGQSPPGARLYNIRGGYAADVTEATRISLPNGAIGAAFADIDNDGWLDLYVIGDNDTGTLLRNDGSGAFRDVTATARLSDATGAHKPIFADLDHDGDLDLLLVGARIRLYRNNLDGTFTEVMDAAGLRIPTTARDAAFADLDGDGRVDVVISSDTRLFLFRNTGFQRFTDVTTERGIATAGTSGAGGGRGGGALALGDYNNDGHLDVFVAGGTASEPALWRNAGMGGGAFTRDNGSAAALRGLARAGVTAVAFLDHDNDGWLDLAAVGRRDLFLLHNDGSGEFVDRTTRLPAPLRNGVTGSGGSSLVINDVDIDGDLDVVVGDSAGLHLLRNDGGNANLAMRVQLLGLRTGSGKNNNFGIGSTIEVRAGEIYQTRVVTERVTHFGLGTHLKADVLRVEWTNGVPQTIYFPGTDQDVLELEQLKGSCAFLYTWDGKQFRFVTDVMWRSALGMPLGIMGGTSRAAFAPAGASQEYLRIPGEALQPRDGKYVLQFTEELWETAYLDRIRMIAVDHPDSIEVFVDERFVPPGPVDLRLFQAVRRTPPRSAIDHRGDNVLSALTNRDDVYVGNFTPTRYQGLVQPHELILDLGPEAGRSNAFLFLRGWIYPTDASINVALGQQSALSTSMPSLEVRNANGQWETAIANIGFPSGKDKTIVIDLAGKFPTADHRVRIRTNMQIYWDQAFVATDARSGVARTTALDPVSAHLHFRGYSRMYRKGGPSGPHWFAYDDVRKESPWRPIEGAFTRFGDVLPLVGRADDQYVIMAPGDEATVQFDARAVPALPAGWKRTFLLYTDGWIKDSDLNTAFGTTVEPLPFHAIQEYPYAAGETYPADSVHQRYLTTYNTRVIKRR